MPARTRLCSETDAAARRGEPLLQELVRSLLEGLEHGRTPGLRCTETDAEETVVDIELDGWRYLLIRTRPPTNSQVQLSPREREIARMVAEGHPNKVIAAVLNISSWTVGTHLRRIFAKLGVASRAAMVARYLEIRRTSGH